jgi:hypothetical protein
MWKYTRVWLKVGTKSCDREIFKDQRARKKSLGIKNEILENYRDYLLI